MVGIGKAAARRAALAASRSPAGVLKVGALGHSFVANAVHANGWTNNGYMAWARRYCGSRVDLRLSNLFATGGLRQDQIIAQHLPSALAAGLDVCVVDTIRNSIGAEGVTTDSLIAGQRQILDGLTTRGTICIVHPVLAASGAYLLSGDSLLQACALERFQADYCRGNRRAIFANVNPLVTDFATGLAVAGTLFDDLHPSLQGARLIGYAIAQIINQFAAPVDDLHTLVGDVYDATKNVSGNLLVNGLMAGTGGTKQNGATGNAPDSWIAAPNSTSTTTLAMSKVAVSGRTNLSVARMTLGGTGDGVQQLLYQQVDGSKWSVGDVVRGLVACEWSITAGSFSEISLNIIAMNSSFAVIGQAIDGVANGTGYYPTGASGAITFRTEDFTIPAGTAYLIFRLHAVAAAGSPNATVDWSRASLRKVAA